MSQIEVSTTARSRDTIVRDSLARHVEGLRAERLLERDAKTDRERRGAYLAIGELQDSYRVLVAMANRFGLTDEVAQAEQRIARDLAEIRAGRAG